MNSKTIIARCMYIGTLAVLLLLPLIQMQVRIVPVSALRGVQKPVCFPKVNLYSIRHGEFQVMAEKWFARNFGLRELWIRLHNQILYTLLRTTPIESTVDVGKNGQLYEKNYMEHYLGIKNPHIENLPEHMSGLKRLQQMLRDRGISLIVCISPSKAAFVPEDIPGFYDSDKRTVSIGYRFMVRLLNENGIPWIDGPGLLRLHRNDSGAPIFPRCSSHWNSVGAFYSADRFVAVAESLAGHPMVHPLLESVAIDHNPSSNDRELANLMNLFLTPADFPVAHVKFGSKGTSEGGNRPRLVVEGGSFNWIWLDALFCGRCLESADFFYYYSKPYAQRYVHRAGKEKEKIKSDVDWEKTMAGIDIVVIEVNESLMNTFPFEFVRDMTKYLAKRQ
jgi:alginate O-acetyltransferase complex protein AlgJ